MSTIILEVICAWTYLIPHLLTMVTAHGLTALSPSTKIKTNNWGTVVFSVNLFDDPPRFSFKHIDGRFDPRLT